MSTDGESRSRPSGTNAPVRRRHVIYVQGYDPRGLAEYYRMFRGEYRKYCALYGLTGKVGRIENSDDRHSTTWTLDTRGDDWAVTTTYEFLRWEDIIRRDFARPAWWKTLYALGSFLGTITTGVYARIWRAHWRFALFVTYPFIILATNLLAALLAGVLLGGAVALALKGLAASVIPSLVGFAAFVAAFVLLVRKTEPLSFMLYMFDDIVSTHQFAHGRRPDWEERFELFAADLIEAVRASDADEILVVGHSSGSFVAVETIARALAREPDFARGRPLSLLTVGGNLPIIGFNPEAGGFRERLRQLAVEPSLDWVDYQSRKDVMNFYPFDPVTGHGLELGAERRNPLVVPVRFRDIIKPDSYGKFRWRFFRVHFQFLMANERKGAAYDYFMICCGPFRLGERARNPAMVVAATEP